MTDKVTVAEIMEALRAVTHGHAKRNKLANRIEAEGIAPPDGMVLVPKLEFNIEYVSGDSELFVITTPDGRQRAYKKDSWVYKIAEAMLAAAQKDKP